MPRNLKIRDDLLDYLCVYLCVFIRAPVTGQIQKGCHGHVMLVYFNLIRDGLAFLA